MVKKACTGKKGLCFWETKKGMEDDIEMEMDSEINRRVLYQQKKYISYETLNREVVPCDRPGAPYYDCHHVGQANPYSRGCEVITRCKGNSSMIEISICFLRWKEDSFSFPVVYGTSSRDSYYCKKMAVKLVYRWRIEEVLDWFPKQRQQELK
ncbi:Ralf-like [Thalictrum thalictroides]|uniref:Ralf-like n=1 Tax=Thalictrum thalictroides TaxID=46969 RepID=A0A7J6WQV7_THATH|nr:Ralf-like [Thalictrum thalictroides]